MRDHDRIEGTARQAGGNIKEAVGKVTGDEKLQAEGKVQNTVGGTKDAVRGTD